MKKHIPSLPILNSHKLISSGLLGNNQDVFYSIKAMILKEYGTFIEYHLQEFETIKPYKKGFGCDCDIDEQEQCTMVGCVGEYKEQHKNILAFYEFEGNTYHLPISDAYYYLGIVHSKQGDDFIKLLPLCTKTIGLKNKMPELEIQREVILDFCKQVLLFLNIKKVTLRDLPNYEYLVRICFENLLHNKLLTEEINIFFSLFLGLSNKNIKMTTV